MLLRWDVFCRVIDNHGDLGVCWRFAADLAARGDLVRLWVDDASALAWMAPQGAPGVSVHPWDAASRSPEPADVVVEAFGCDLPDAFVAAMASRPAPPAWINLEYLSAEDYVERSHRLASPQMAGPGRGLRKWFWYPGFTAGTGGLLREPGLARALAGFDRDGWLRERGLPTAPRLASVFCYPGAPVDRLPALLAGGPWHLLLTPGAPCPDALPSTALPYLPQRDYDRLLWACDLNAVRGEDSFVRAQWAARPFVWHIYPQHDGAHVAKLDAFLARFLAGAPAALARDVRALWHGWNGLVPMPAALPDLAAWTAHCRAWRDGLCRREDLVTGLRQFVRETG